MKKIAIPISKGKLSKYLKECTYFEIYNIQNNNINSNEIIIADKNKTNHISSWAIENKLTDIIIHKAKKEDITSLSENKINLFIGITINKPDFLINDYLDGQLKSDEKIIQKITSKTK